MAIQIGSSAILIKSHFEVKDQWSCLGSELNRLMEF
jgi:hypothetical protein